MSGQHNAEAGPSTPLYLKPNRPKQPPPPIASTYDLLARFQLLPAYDKYVRSFVDDHHDTQDNGKGKAREQNASPTPQTPGDQDPDDDDPAQTKGEKKKKNTYKHLIKGIPGKHSMKRDDYLASIMQVPPKQRIQIVPFDLQTQRVAFSVSLEGLKGWTTNTLIQESAQAREDRKKRKELKRLAKMQAHLHAQAAAAAAAGSPAPVSAAGTPRPGAGTPRSGSTPRPAESRHRPLVPPVAVPGRVATPQRQTGVATPTSALRTAAGTPTSAVQRTGTPHPLSAQPLSAGGAAERGIKREREPEVLGSANAVNGAAAPVSAPLVAPGGQNVVNGVPRAPVPVIAAAKAGLPGVRPRPIKKQRVDMQGQARDVSAVHQQPTPQGV
ncbi:hypothetical protein GGX14DRAFT_418740 [Mycena pura]|uniref:Uncharacterized protein n=1 Tax=Mycena pura TaxID=153505 RepID=A0AAD6YRN5_9AGAR|nr:hypothetical protein GGX14DRAFT_418740 [Mycena pura]